MTPQRQPSLAEIEIAMLQSRYGSQGYLMLRAMRNAMKEGGLGTNQPDRQPGNGSDAGPDQTRQGGGSGNPSGWVRPVGER